MKFILAAIFFVAIIHAIFASAISKLATGTSSNLYATYGTLAEQIARIVDPKPDPLHFNTGGYAPQYVELELPCLCTIHNVFLQVEQTPASGLTKHQLYAGPTANPAQLVSTLEGVTTHGQWIHINFSPPLTDIRFLRLKTVTSPSWVAWKKFLVF